MRNAWIFMPAEFNTAASVC